MDNSIHISPHKERTAQVVRQSPVRSHSKTSLWASVIRYFKTKRQAASIMKGLNEAEKIHTGRLKGKPFDEFLKEI